VFILATAGASWNNSLMAGFAMLGSLIAFWSGLGGCMALWSSSRSAEKVARWINYGLVVGFATGYPAGLAELVFTRRGAL
jgi:hypothetical protein